MIDTGQGGTGPGEDVEQSKMSLMIQPDTRDEAINASDQQACKIGMNTPGDFWRFFSWRWTFRIFLPKTQIVTGKVDILTAINGILEHSTCIK